MLNRIQTRITFLLLLISTFFIIGLLLRVNSEKDKFEKVLQERTNEKEELVGKVISTLGENLRAFAYDYSYWDDMLKFLSTGDRSWAYVNIVSVLPTFRANAVWVYKKDFTLVYSTDTLNTQGLGKFPLETAKLKTIVESDWFPHFFINLPQGIMEVRGAPIQPSADIKRETTPQGFLFTGRIWDKKYLQELAALSASSTELVDPGSSDESPNNNNPDQIIFTSQKVLRDCDGNPIGIFKAKTEFPMMGEVFKRARTELWISILFAIVILGAISLFLFRYVITPLKKISGSVEKQDPSLIQSLLNDKSEFGKLSMLIDKFFRQKSSLLKEIEERKLIQAELRRSEEMYRAIFENTGTASLIIEEDNTVSLVNAELERLSGYKASELVGKSKWTDFVFPEDLEMMRARHELRRLDPEAALSKYEIRLKDKNGSIGYYINNVGVIPGTKKSIVSLIDITERRRAEEELRKFSYAVEKAPVSIMITDPEGMIEYVNPYCLNVTGYNADEVLGLNPRLLKSGETPQEEYFKLWNTIKSGNQWKGEFHNKKKSGELYWEVVSISPIKNEKDEIIHFIGIRENITEWKEIEQELKQARDKAEASDRLKSEFLAQMSHEIRTPINTILSYSSLIRSELEGSVNDEMKFCFRNIASAGDRIIRTIDLILNMSELQTGSYEYSPRPFDLYEDVLEKVYSGFLQAAREKKLQLLLNRNTPETSVQADEYSISQTIINLVDNAIKYTNKGTVSITILRDPSSSLVVEVADTGIGINSEFLPHLFSPFAQEEQGYTRRFEGNGLGLALVKKYCELNNLRVEVQTEKHCGTTFRVIFPS